MREHGRVEGGTFLLEERYADGDVCRRVLMVRESGTQVRFRRPQPH